MIFSTQAATRAAVCALLLCTGLLWGCSSADHRGKIQQAETFIDAFYAFDPARLSATMAPGADAERMLYYQGWAEAANYAVKVRRPCQHEGDAVVCRITVTDDFGSTLGYTATDTFTMQIDQGKIVAIQSQGDDPPIFMELFTWIGEHRPEIMSGPCRDMFDGGTTPGACARAVADSADAFVNVRAGDPDQHDK